MKKVIDINGTFYVPAYQRGFRWEDRQVTLLLDDLKKNEDNDYCLQPIVVRRLPNSKYELIDGQQRLTTLYLILAYMKSAKLQNFDFPFEMEYETRPRSKEFLCRYRDGNCDDFNDSDENIDFFHFNAVYAAVKKWFEQETNSARRQCLANNIFRWLCERVNVIWYEVQTENPEALFTRLNIGKIPLTNSELIKALFLSKAIACNQQVENLTPIEIATQWDMIEKELNEDDFWAFITNTSPMQYPSRIEILFDTIAQKGSNKNPFHTFDHFNKELEYGKSIKKLWGDTQQKHQLLKEWYSDKNLYHKVGYLISTGKSISELVCWSEGCRKSEFNKKLDIEISNSITVKKGGTVKPITDLSYKEDSSVIERILLLFNIETLQNTNDKYPFLFHKKEGWSLEHIHAQNSESLTKKDQWQEWLKCHCNALKKIDSEVSKSLIAEIETSIHTIDGEQFSSLSREIIMELSEKNSGLQIDGLGNLALLPCNINSALSNGVFEVKRQKIVQSDMRGEYIPICTRRVFLKYYDGQDIQQVHFWSVQDYDAYLKEIQQKIVKYTTHEMWGK